MSFFNILDYPAAFKDMVKLVQSQPPPRGERITWNNDMAKTIIEDLSLKELYRKKITIQEVMKVATKEEESSNPANEVFFWLKNILLLDFKARDRDVCKLTSTLNTTDANISDNDSEDDFFNDSEEEPEILYPLDNIVLIYPLCDIFLQLLLAHKFFHCRLALPLVVPNFYSEEFELILTPLTNITLDCLSDDDAISACSALDAPSNIVSFVRMGSLEGVSKSAILNSVVDSTNHPTFVHHNAPNGNAPRKLSNGMVELTWHIPRNRDEKEQNITCLNLRGDSTQYKSQLDLISEISNTIVCFIQFEKMSDPTFMDSLSGIDPNVSLILVLNVRKGSKGDGKSKAFKESLQKIHTNVKYIKLAAEKGIASFIKELTQKVQDSFNVDDITRDTNKVLGSLTGNKTFSTDLSRYSQELQLSKLIMNEVEKHETRTAKNVLLPLQGKLWKKWSRNTKRYHRNVHEELSRGDQTQIEVAERIKRKLEEVRRLQLDKLADMSSVATMFISTLLADATQCNIHIFLHFLNNFLNSKCQKVLPSLFKHFDLLQKEKTKHRLDRIFSSIDEKIVEAEKDIMSSSLGLEHFFRELSQVYEVAKKSPYGLVYNSLVSVVASLVIKGQPLELIDGDVCNISLTWVTDVLQCVKEMVGNKRVLVLSVLGIQSSGKSTLLNTMFGLQFAVSAGRCTKGVYMQLVKAGALPFEYVLVLDTEGLKSMEMTDSQLRDNELATFVIGIGDVTIINIKGENYDEMKNVIQIAVTAFFRMSQVHGSFNLNKRCIFIHQNTSDANAKSYNKLASRKLLETLDEMTGEAAKHEKLHKVNTFNQIIKFDCEEDVWFFPDFWQGNPPMGHVNTQYSREVVKVRENIFDQLGALPCDKYKTFNDITEYLKMLWQAILNENFVFSFKNCMEIKAHYELESEYKKLVMAIRRDITQWTDSVVKKIPLRETHETVIQNLEHDVQSELEEFGKKKLTHYTKKLNDFCLSNPYKSIMKDWLPKRIADLEREIQKQSTECIMHFLMRVDDRRYLMEVEKYEERHRVLLMNEAIALAKGSGVFDQGAMDKQFEKLWSKVATSSAYIDLPDTTSKVERDVTRALYRSFLAYHHLVRKALDCLKFEESDAKFVSQIDIEEGFLHISNDDIGSIRSIGTNWREHVEYIRTEIDGTLQPHINEFINKMADRQYDTTVLSGLLEIVEKWCDKAYQLKDMTIVILPVMRVNLAVVAMQVAFIDLCHMHRRGASLRPLMQGHKEKLKKFFKLMCRKSGIEKIILENICDDVCILLLSHMQSVIPKLVHKRLADNYGTKTELLVFVLKTLADKDTFSDYLLYFANPKEAAFRIIKHEIQNMIGKDELYKDPIDEIVRKLGDCLGESGQYFSSQPKILASDWVKQFWQSAGKNLFQENVICELSSLPPTYVISDLAAFNKQMEQQLVDTLRKVINQLKTSPLDTMGLQDRWIINLVDSFWGCHEECPFCGEPCCQSSSEHFQAEKVSHRCIQHRPAIVKWKRKKEFTDATIYNCNYHVALKTSHYLEGPGQRDWYIEPSTTMDCSPYWQWFVARYSSYFSQLVQRTLQLPPVPESWNRLTLEDAKSSLFPS